MARVIAAYAGMCLIWGTTWLGIKIGLHYIPPIAGVGLRFIIAGLVMYAFALWRGHALAPSRLPWKVVIVFSTMLFGLNYILTYTAETRLDSGLVAVLFGTLPFFTFAFGALLADEKTTPVVWLGALIAFGGVALISIGGAVQAAPAFALAAIGAALFSAFANVYAKRHQHHDALVTLPPSMLLAGIGVLLTGLATERVDWHAALAPPSIAALLYLALLGSGLAFFLNIWVLQRIPVWIVGLSSLIVPVLAVAVGVAFGNEHFGVRELLGAACVAVGIGIAVGFGTRRVRGEVPG